jgi:hypothetical protein
MTGRPRHWSPRANGTLMARKINNGSGRTREQLAETGSDLGINYLERVTRIELALSAWESVPSGPVTWRVQLVVTIGCLEGTATPALCRPAKTHVASERNHRKQSFHG